eukprot:g832.t1
MSAKQVAQAATVISVAKATKKKAPKKPEKSILCAIPNPFDKEGPPIRRGVPHWTEVLFLIIFIASIVMIFVSTDTQNTADQKKLIASIGIWSATAVSVITMYYNFGLFDRKRNAASAEYLEGHVQEMIKYNEDLYSLTGDMDKINEKNKRTQAKAELVEKQLSHVAEYLGGAKKIATMLNSGFDKFLKENMKQLEKQETQVRESQINMMDQSLDRMSELLIFSFVGIDKDNNSVLEGEELIALFEKLKQYQLCESKKAFFDHFPIGLDIDAGEDGTLLDKICNFGAKKSSFKKETFIAEVKGILASNDDDLELTFIKGEHKKKFLELLVKHKIVQSSEEYFDKIHGIDRYLILEGMNERIDDLKATASNVLVEYDQVMKKLNAKEAELKKLHPTEGISTKIDLNIEILNAAKSSVPATTGAQKN